MTLDEVLESKYFEKAGPRYGENAIRFNDGRYDYRVWLDRDRFDEERPFMTAGCRRWTTHGQAINHYDENYRSDGDPVLCRAIIDKLSKLHAEYREREIEKRPKLVAGWINATGNEESEKTYPGNAEVSVEWDADDSYQTVRLSIDGRWFTRDGLAELRDDINAIVEHLDTSN
jgi:hypothetical protein